MSVGFERFIACFIMDLQDFFTGLNQYIVTPGVREKYSRQTEVRQHQVEWIIFKLIVGRFVLEIPMCIRLKMKKTCLCKRGSLFQC